MKKDVGMTPCQKLLKQEGTARWIESMQKSSATPKNRDVGRGLRKHALNPPHSAFLFQQFLAWCHPFFIFNDFYTSFTHFSQQCIAIGNGTVGKQRRIYTQPPPRLYRGRASFVHSAAVRLPATPTVRTLIS